VRIEECGGKITVSISDPALARKMAGALARAVSAATPSPDGFELRVVRFRTSARLAQLETKKLAGAVAIVRVTERNARRLEEWIARVRRAGALGAQLVWGGETAEHPTRAARHVFRAMEMVRSTPSEAPVVLAATDEPVAMLRDLIRMRMRTRTSEKKGDLP